MGLSSSLEQDDYSEVVGWIEGSNPELEAIEEEVEGRVRLSIYSEVGDDKTSQIL